MEKLGRTFSSKEIDEIMEVHDVRGDGKLNYEEFVLVIVGNEKYVIL